MKERLDSACRALREAMDEFIAAHAEWRGGHAPVLWVTYDDGEAIVVAHRSWIAFINDHFRAKGEPSHTMEFHAPSSE